MILEFAVCSLAGLAARPSLDDLPLQDRQAAQTEQPASVRCCCPSSVLAAEESCLLLLCDFGDVDRQARQTNSRAGEEQRGN
jgi:hypothetical protein